MGMNWKRRRERSRDQGTEGTRGEGGVWVGGILVRIDLSPAKAGYEARIGIGPQACAWGYPICAR
jgi:hypothetical protein